MRIINPTVHGVLDYAAAAVLIAAPFALTLEGAALWFSVAAGLALAGYSLLTDYRFGTFPVVPFRGHLLLDSAAAAAFLLLPVLLGLGGISAAYYYTMGAGVVLVVVLSNTGAVAPSPG